jgi:hypothetical protein
MANNHFVESTHEKTHQGKRFDCVPMGITNEKGTQSVDTRRNISRDKRTKRTRKAKEWQI